MSKHNTPPDDGAAAEPIHMTSLRAHLMSTLASLRDRTNPMEPDRARAVAQVASVLVETAKVEVDYLRLTHRDNADFLSPPPKPRALPNGITGVTVHRISDREPV